jgi:hypothetical protein
MARFDSLSEVFLLRPDSYRGDYIYAQRPMGANWTPITATLDAIICILSTSKKQLIIEILLYGLTFTRCLLADSLRVALVGILGRL